MRILTITLLLFAATSGDSTWSMADAGSLGLGLIPVEGLAPAKRIDKDRIAAEQEAMIPKGLNGMPFAPEGLGDCDEMNFYRVQAGLPSIFQSLGWRESNCRNEESVHTSCCWGYWQLWVSLHLSSSIGSRYRNECDINSRYDVDSDSPLDKQRQACGAKVLYETNGLAPWR